MNKHQPETSELLQIGTYLTSDRGFGCPIVIHVERQQTQHSNIKTDVPTRIETRYAVLTHRQMVIDYNRPD
jgi:hypothetical protein